MKQLHECMVMIVDDNQNNIDILAEILADKYEIMVAMDGKNALNNMRLEPPDLALLDIVMPGMDGLEMCRQMQMDPVLKDISVIFVTAMGTSFDEQAGLEVGAVDYLVKPVQPGIVQARVRNHLELLLARKALLEHNQILEKKVQERTRELEVNQDTTLECLASLAETRDPETGYHILRTKQNIEILIDQLNSHSTYLDNFTSAGLRTIAKASPLHDVGKVGVPDHILLKPGKLTFEEFEIIKNHTIYGWQALSRAVKDKKKNHFLLTAAEIAYSHHEKWDGSGYPRGLKGQDIPLSGRLVMIADIYDALRTPRAYKPAFSHAKAVEIITVGDGYTSPDHFDPELLRAFKASHELFAHTNDTYQDDL